ncbi:MAG TPA: OsmC family protein [Methylomirabilota bacterium]|nr:OsmC family protein [Methylomirabilota bacterium]
MTVRLYAERKQWPLERVDVRLRRDAGEGKIASIEMELAMRGALSEEQRQRLQDISTRCPVHRTLMEGVQITHR